MVEAAKDLAIQQCRVCRDIFVRGRRKTGGRMKRSCHRVAVIHAEAIQDMLEVGLLRQTDCLQLAITGDFYAKVFRRRIIPFDVVEVAKVATSRLEE